MPLVSIIIPAYNYVNFLARAVDSAIAQDYDQFEVIIVDDGSTDGTTELAETYIGRVKVIRQVNQGLAAARNTGIAQSKGLFIIFLDADDWMEPYAVSSMVKKFIELPVDYGVVACQKNVVDRMGTVISTRDLSEKNFDVEVVWEDLVLSRPEKRFLPFALIKREVFDKSGFFDASYGRLGSEDREFFIRVSLSFRICRMSECLLNYTIHGLNMSADPGRQLPGMLKCLRSVKASNVRPGWHLIFWGKVYSFFHYQASGMYRDIANHPKALGHILKSLFFYPLLLSNPTFSLPHFNRIRRLFVCLRDSLQHMSYGKRPSI